MCKSISPISTSRSDFNFYCKTVSVFISEHRITRSVFYDARNDFLQAINALLPQDENMTHRKISWNVFRDEKRGFIIRIIPWQSIRAEAMRMYIL